jgi:hypothetical protein
MRVIAFDPGPHTGIAVFNGWEFVDSRTLVAKTGVLFPLYSTIESLIRDNALRNEGMYVIIERFRTVSPSVSGSESGVLTGKLCGFIEGTALINLCPVVWHTSAERMPFVKAAKALKVAHTEHEVSAIAHAFAFLEKRQKAGDAP